MPRVTDLFPSFLNSALPVRAYTEQCVSSPYVVQVNAPCIMRGLSVSYVTDAEDSWVEEGFRYSLTLQDDFLLEDCR